MFYVYIHCRADTGEPFYVGKGKGKRAYSKSGRNFLWKHIVETQGYKIKIISYFSDELEALKEEVKVIKELRGTGVNLVNKTSGGQGVSGLSKIPWNKGKPWSQDIKDKFSRAHKGKKLSDEHKKNIGRFWKGRKRKQSTPAWNKGKKTGLVPGNARPIVDNFGVEYTSAQEAARKLNLVRSDICACLNGRQKTTGGYTFYYLVKEVA